ncbi:MAG: trypsin-like peptidase domain-containing protein [Atribacterota bacterium]|nr:trypsin-like peptidase domain-containing protein [Atribacterota bacterium]
MMKMKLIKINRNTILATALIFLLCLSWIGVVSAETEQTNSSLTLEAFSNSIADIAEKNGPAVVNIDTVRMVETQNPFLDDPIFGHFFGDQFREYTRTIPQKGTGSGFIINQEGYIITNEHVVHKADKIKVTLSDGREFTGEVIGSDTTSDMAIVKIKADHLPLVVLGDSDQLRVGEIVVAIGNPYGLQQTVTMGVVSAKGRSIPTGIEGHVYKDFIQTDTAINPGNSGGPLLNTKGEVVGINTAIIPFAQGIGFAIPINIAKKNIDDLINLGKVRRSWLGVYIQEVTPEIAQQFNLTEAKGVLVGDVVKDSPAEEVGIKTGDIVKKVNDEEVNSPEELQDKIGNIKIGEKANIEVVRNGETISFIVKIGEMPTVENEGTETPKEKVFSVQTGLKVEPVTKEIAQELGLPWVKGLVISEVILGSSADDMGLQQGDIVLEANRTEISSIEEWEKVINKLEPGDTLLLLVFRNQHTYYVPIKVEKID